MFSVRVGASLTALVCLLPASTSAGDKEKEALSALSKITVTEKKDDVAVTVVGSRAPDFTSFTMSNPFRVVVDWAGSKIEGAPAEQKFPRGLIRTVRTKQYDSEAERISRVTIELSRETTYHVEAAGTRVTIHFEPVPDPIPEPAPAPEPVAKKEEKKELVYVPEGPLTEPDLPVPANPPPPPAPPVLVAKVDPKPPPPPPAPTPPPGPLVVAKAEPKKEEPKKEEPKAAPPPPKAEPVVAKVEPKKEEPKKVAPQKEEPIVVAKVEKKEEPKAAPPPEPKKEEPKKVEPPKKEEPVVVAKIEPKKEEPKTAPVKEEPKKLASFEPKPKEETVRVMSPQPRNVRRTPNHRTNQFASNAPKDLSSGWTPPGAGRDRRSASVRYSPAAQETIQPDGETPVDPDEPDTGSTSTGGGGGGDSDFDPGPRLMKYIGFRQMADVSRVFVRLDGKAKYKQKKEGDTVVVELVNTSVPVKNNTRPLDTSYFNSPVGSVQAVPSGDSTRIEIKLKEQVPFQVKRIGTTIAIDFTRK